jgi:hypothetical protein
LTDFRVKESAIPTPGPGQVLLQVQYLSLDPSMRGRMDDCESYARPAPLGGVMPGESVATVVASRAIRDAGAFEGRQIDRSRFGVHLGSGEKPRHARVCNFKGGGRICSPARIAPVSSALRAQACAMTETRTTVVIQRYLDDLGGDSPAEPIVRALLDRAVRRLHMLCATLLYKSYPRLTQRPLNL